MASGLETRYVLAFGHDAARVAEADGVVVLRRLPLVVLVETTRQQAAAFAESGEYVAVYRSVDDALRAFSVFE